MIDPHFHVEVLTATPNPQTAVYAALHQDYSEGFVYDDRDKFPSESQCGRVAVDRLLKSHRGHYGPLEHPQITLNCGWFPHSTMQQMRTHRLASFDVQSGRYTGNRVYELGRQWLGAWTEQMISDAFDKAQEVFYLRPIGSYTDRQGKRYEYTQDHCLNDIEDCLRASAKYASRIDDGFSEEHARGLLPFDIRQHWVLSVNLRGLMHLLTVRGKKDAQLECQQLCALILPLFQSWCPEIAAWYTETLWQKGRLAP